MHKSISEALSFLDSRPDTMDGPFAPVAQTEDRLYAIYLRVPLETRQELKRLAIDRGSTSQRLMQEALDDLFIKYRGKPL
ncbi:MAG: hypothetical protein EON59_06390 [Alphaproteobacteria bacterium]|nr:MAG: hypothetical protein EON59_06390 [Alphaproteobacteria bacterium]